MFRTTAAIAVVIALATAAQANPVTGGFTSEPSLGVVGLTKYTIWLESSTTAFEGFEINVVDDDGELNHVFMGNTIYEDFNFALTPEQISQDTQVLFLTPQVRPILPPEYEDHFTLTASFYFDGGEGDPLTGTHLDIVQVVVPTVGGDGYVHGQALVGGQEFDYYVEFPEPATLSLLAMGGIALLRRKR